MSYIGNAKGSTSSADNADISQEKNNNQKLPSPPVSPNRVKQGLQRSIDGVVMSDVKKTATAENEKRRTINETWLTIRPYRPGSIKTDVVTFLSAYNKVCTKGCGAKRRYSPKVTKPVNVKRRLATYTSEEDVSPALGSQAALVVPAQLNYTHSTSSRSYATRSRANVGDDESGNPEESLRDSVPRSFVGVSKRDFLKSCSVQLIHDVDAESLPDFAPPMQHLTQQLLEKLVKRAGFTLNVLLKDETRLEEVPSSEVSIVAAFKLTPQQYLETKRRFFAEKARKTFLGTTFKKTDAQKACKIDVNKASKLYEVFQGCGLLEDSLYHGL